MSSVSSSMLAGPLGMAHIVRHATSDLSTALRQLGEFARHLAASTAPLASAARREQTSAVHVGGRIRDPKTTTTTTTTTATTKKKNEKKKKNVVVGPRGLGSDDDEDEDEDNEDNDDEDEAEAVVEIVEEEEEGEEEEEEEVKVLEVRRGKVVRTANPNRPPHDNGGRATNSSGRNARSSSTPT